MQAPLSVLQDGKTYNTVAPNSSHRRDVHNVTPNSTKKGWKMLGILTVFGVLVLSVGFAIGSLNAKSAPAASPRELNGQRLAEREGSFQTLIDGTGSESLGKPEKRINFGDLTDAFEIALDKIKDTVKKLIEGTESGGYDPVKNPVTTDETLLNEMKTEAERRFDAGEDAESPDFRTVHITHEYVSFSASDVYELVDLYEAIGETTMDYEDLGICDVWKFVGGFPKKVQEICQKQYTLKVINYSDSGNERVFKCSDHRSTADGFDTYSYLYCPKPSLVSDSSRCGYEIGMTLNQTTFNNGMDFTHTLNEESGGELETTRLMKRDSDYSATDLIILGSIAVFFGIFLICMGIALLFVGGPILIFLGVLSVAGGVTLIIAGVNEGGCFAIDSIVSVLDEYTTPNQIISKEIHELQNGDKVMAVDSNGNIFFDDVYYRNHIYDFTGSEEESTLMILDHSEGSISISGQHLVYSSTPSWRRPQETDNCVLMDNGQQACPVPANTLSIGDIFWVTDGVGEKLVPRELIQKRFKKSKVRSPYTMNGNIVVDGVLCSVYSKHHRITQMWTAPQRVLYRMWKDGPNHPYFERFWAFANELRPDIRDAALEGYSKGEIVDRIWEYLVSLVSAVTDCDL